ncbi:MAG: hypothetical protein ACYDD2_02090 [Candidatus Acidiferrales bacterium]
MNRKKLEVAAMSLAVSFFALIFAARARAQSASCNVSKSPEYFSGTSYLKPPSQKKSNSSVVGAWQGTATGAGVASCQMSPGGWDANHCAATPGVNVIMMTTVNHKANFAFKVSRDGSVTGDGTVTYSLDVNTSGLDAEASRVRGLAGMAGAPAAVPGYSLRFANGPETRHFTFGGQLVGVTPKPSGTSTCTQLPPGGTYVVERDKNYEAGPITLNFPCGGNGTFRLSGGAPGGSSNNITYATGTVTPDGNLFDFCVPVLGVNLTQQPISVDASANTLTLPFMLFGLTSPSGGYTIFKLYQIKVKGPHHYALEITSVNVEGGGIKAVSTVGNSGMSTNNAQTKTVYMPAFAPFGNEPVEVKKSSGGGYYIYEDSEKPNINEPGVWARFKNEWTAKKKD